MDQIFNNTLEIGKTLFKTQFLENHQKTQVEIEDPTKFQNKEEIELSNPVNIKENLFRRQSVVEQFSLKM